MSLWPRNCSVPPGFGVAFSLEGLTRPAAASAASERIAPSARTVVTPSAVRRGCFIDAPLGSCRAVEAGPRHGERALLELKDSQLSAGSLSSCPALRDDRPC